MAVQVLSVWVPMEGTTPDALCRDDGQEARRPEPRATKRPVTPTPHRALRSVSAVDRVTITVPLDPCLTLKALASYSGIGVRTLRAHLTDALRPLPHYRVGGKIVVRRSEFDAWLLQYRATGPAHVQGIVEDVVRGLRDPVDRRGQR